MINAGVSFDEADVAALRLPIPIEGLEQTLMGLYILYGEPLVLRSQGRFLIVSRPGPAFSHEEPSAPTDLDAERPEETA